MDTVIETEGLTKCYNARAVVDDLTLTVRRGEIYAFIGLNGAGKTTTIRMLLGMIRPTRGVARLFGAPVSAGALNLWTDAGYLVETPHAYPELSVRENLEVSRRLYGLAEPPAVDRIIEQLRLSSYAEQRAGTLSLGNAQRLGLARALLHAPKLLILDEPANGLDPAGVVEVRDLLRDLAQSHGATIFISSHILGEVARLATRIGIIHKGRLLEELDAAEIAQHYRRWLSVDARDRPAARAALLAAGYAVGETKDGALGVDDERAVTRPDDIARLLVQAGAPPTRLAVEQEDLETHFLGLVGSGQGESR